MKNTTTKIYGVSSVNNFGWEHTVYVFESDTDAQRWLSKETQNFAERELMSKAAAIKLAGASAVKNAIVYPALDCITGDLLY